MIYFQYVVEHVEQLAKLLAYLVLPCAVFTSLLKRIYFNYRFKAPKKTIKLIMYLKKYDKFLKEDDKQYISYLINDEIMRDAAKIPTSFNRKELVYIANRIEKKGYIKQLYKLQNYIEVANGHYHITVKFYDTGFFISRLMSLLMAALFFTFIALGVISIIQSQAGFTPLICLLLALIMEFAGLWMYDTFPGKKTINKINLELNKFKVPE